MIGCSVLVGGVGGFSGFLRHVFAPSFSFGKKIVGRVFTFSLLNFLSSHFTGVPKDLYVAQVSRATAE